MAYTLKYGSHASITIESTPDADVIDRATPGGEPIQDIRAATLASLAEPLEFPALRQATAPGDPTAIAVDPAVPQAPAIVAAVVDELLSGHCEPEDLFVVRVAAAQQDDLLAEVPAGIRSKVRVCDHHPDQQDELAYLAAAADGEPIYVNRQLHEAGLVVPIGCLRAHDSLGYTGVHAGLFPTFADAEAQRRFLAPGSTDRPDEHRRRCEEVREATWLLGVTFSVQVVPSGGGDALDIFAGSVDAVMKAGAKRCEQAWSLEVPHPTSLVIAGIEGGDDQQTWDNVARALAAAQRVVEDRGAIALCTELKAPPGKSLLRLVDADVDSYEHLQHKLHEDRTHDALAASQLLSALDSNRVYLLSGLDEEVVEGLGVAYIKDADELSHLCGHHDSVLMLGAAQHCVPTVRGG
jgi:nickel-dependent lactate racemase